MKCISVSYKILPYQISFGGEIIALEHNGGTALCPGALYIALMAHYIIYCQCCLLLMFIGYRYISWE